MSAKCINVKCRKGFTYFVVFEILGIINKPEFCDRSVHDGLKHDKDCMRN